MFADRGASADHDTTRLLEAFDAASGPLTIAELQRHGVQMPGQALYELQLAGYRVARVYGRDEERRRTLLGYRLDRPAAPPPPPSPPSPPSLPPSP